ncbi:hypothetical protein RA180_13455 [Aeromonas salmonicida]|uniref:hypothetical protein n=1 Tax=Aeromonas salmonicida TaxID=645 RepID=UPI0027968027|nr:hypothetical protein [Aeromonas salmonicida]MDQ1884998.1 hypothetical protein [Aeromonas salmonicida]
MAAKNISELNLDDFVRIQGPDKGSARDGSRVMVGRAGDRDSCVKLVDGKLQVTGDDEFRRTVEEAYEAKQTPSSGFGSAPYRPQPTPEPEPTLSKLMPATQGPEIEVFDVGYYWNEFHQSKEAVYKKLYGPEANFQQQSMFERNNEHLQDMVLPGEIVILANSPKTLAEKDRLTLLKTQAITASKGIQQLTPEEAEVLKAHIDLFDYVATQDLSTPSAAFGGISTAISQRLGDLHNSLNQIQLLYVAHAGASKGGKLAPEFYSQRKELFSKLDNALEKMTMSSVKIPEYEKLKHRLGLSTKSVTHNWRTVSRHGEVAALGDRLNYISNYVKGANRLGWISVGLDSFSAANTAAAACTDGIGQQCLSISAREAGRVYGSFIGGTWGASAGANLAVAGAASLAIVVGGTLSAPVIAIVAISGAVVGGYYAGDAVGNTVGAVAESATNGIYEVIRMVRGNE